MKLSEIPEKFDSIEQANQFWKILTGEKNQTKLKVIEAQNTAKRIKEAKETDKEFFNNVFATLLENYH